ncbi:uncharacterized protein LAESUDRAFT_105570 [Laetiporus sulphureus 93-53]|uniref:F-box domain-containing protein n=1 Tax=Laetiporus sulphureus 93-53 TaxID=1314785 RepID=A0A165EUA8_9APHY|nr:uncharacterized protein LAESUDRAFT_105570 [Laetiporus sulphureus 93-53]KZT07776.1 hypothetical protein LAESUDRAFT_105570 [Laetiporus sulphureus 93-53]
MGDDPTVRNMETAQEGSAWRALPILPADVWEIAIDHLWDQPRTLMACTLVCSAWYPRSRFHLLRRAVLRKRQDLHGFARVLKRMPSLRHQVKDLVIERRHPVLGNRLPVDYLSTAIRMLAGKLPKLDTLCISHSMVTMETLHPDVFLHMSIFSSVTRLHFTRLVVWSLSTFGNLICALPAIVELRCSSLAVSQKTPFTSTVFSGNKKRAKITTLYLASHVNKGVIEFLVTTGAAENLQKITLDNLEISNPVRMPPNWAIQQLVNCAGASLTELDMSFSEVPLSLGQADRPDTMLSYATNNALRTLTVGVRRLADKHIDWMLSTQPTLKSERLETIVIVLDSRRQDPPKTPGGDTPRLLSAVLSPPLCVPLDTMLSSDSFKCVKTVEIRFLANIFSQVIPDAKQWEDHVVPCFPRLVQRAILRTSVKVDMDEP